MEKDLDKLLFQFEKTKKELEELQLNVFTLNPKVKELTEKMISLKEEIDKLKMEDSNNE